MNEVKTYQLCTIEDVVAIGTTLTRSWFRGHSGVYGQLTPRIFRSVFDDPFYQMMRPVVELEIIEIFRREVPTAEGVPLPAEDDELGWLYLMQHYRTPTRLLDWTQNVLVALFFAVSSDYESDAELWALYPQALNAAAHVGDGMPVRDLHPIIKFLFKQPYWAAGDAALAEKLQITRVPDRPVAFVPTRRFERLVRQSGAFTIHPRPTAGNTIPEIVQNEKHLVRYVIPADRKPDLAEDLYNLGIDHFTLFPELEGLSKRIAHEVGDVAYSPPEPPQCDGPWKTSLVAS